LNLKTSAEIITYNFINSCIIAGKPAIIRLLENLRAAGITNNIIVVGAYSDQIMGVASKRFQDVAYVYQAMRRGTGNAAKVGLHYLQESGFAGDVIIVPGDAHIEPAVIERLVSQYNSIASGAPRPILYRLGCGGRPRRDRELLTRDRGACSLYWVIEHVGQRVNTKPVPSHVPFYHQARLERAAAKKEAEAAVKRAGTTPAESPAIQTPEVPVAPAEPPPMELGIDMERIVQMRASMQNAFFSSEKIILREGKARLVGVNNRIHCRFTFHRLYREPAK
jgi:hypothetical protein